MKNKRLFRILSTLIQLIFLPFPWFIRKHIFRTLGYKFGKGARIGRSLILAKSVLLEANASIGSMNYIGEIDELRIGKNSTIGSLNWITGFSVHNKFALSKGHFQHIHDRKCCLILKEESAITSRHYIDCNGGVYIGKFSIIAGCSSQFLTHSIDLRNNRQDAAPIIIGDHVFISTRSTILKGSVMPDKSVLAACSIYSAKNDQSGLYGGVPAKFIKDCDDYRFFARTTGYVI